jgi:hypothetical protein
MGLDCARGDTIAAGATPSMRSRGFARSTLQFAAQTGRGDPCRLRPTAGDDRGPQPRGRCQLLTLPRRDWKIQDDDMSYSQPGTASFAALLALSAAACVGSIDPSGYPDNPDPETQPVADTFLDEWDVLPLILDGAYRGDLFEQINRNPVLSSVAPGRINVWVSRKGADEYRQVRPDATGSGIEVPRGTIIVREVLDRTGAVESLTLMVRGQEGLSPGNGDFWYALVDPEGWPRFEHGEPVLGPLEQRCAGCHLPRATDGFLFGVPREDRRFDGPAHGAGLGDDFSSDATL